MQSLLKRIAAGEDLSVDEMAQVMDRIMQGACREDDVAQLLLGLRHKGETVAEIAGAALALRKHMTTIRTRRAVVVDTCGTGGDGSGTFNISTAAALVAAAAGVAVAKHGNRGVTSKSGSADVLSELGVLVEAPVETVERCLDELGICFCFAPHLHPCMKHVAPVRQRLGVPTIFNLLGPLCNPASAPCQLLGVGQPALRPRLAEALRLLNANRAVVVCGEDGLDEVTLGGRTLVSDVRGGEIRDREWTPGDFGLAPAEMRSLQADGPPQSAAIIRQVLSGQHGPARDIVLINAAAAIWTTENEATSLDQCRQRAAEAIDGGQAQHLLAQWSKASRA